MREKAKPYRPASFPAAKSLAFHPVVLNGLAYVAEAGRIFSFDLKTGESRVAFDSRALEIAPTLSEAEYGLPNLLDADFTLTVHAGRLYARLGNVALPTNAEVTNAKLPSSLLVVLQPLKLTNPPKNALTLKATATLAPPVGNPGKVVWEGAPLVVDGKLFAACTRIDERGRWVHAVTCYDDSATGRPNWVVDVADTDATAPRSRHEVLTLAGGNVILALPQGLAVALDRHTGKMAWAFRSPPAARAPANGSQQDLCPAVYSGGQLFFAPADGDKLFALDAESGRPVWEAGPMQVEQILGATQNRVIVTVAGPQKGIRAYDIATGSDQEPRGWRNHDDPFLASYGRGLLTADAVLWPTKEKLYTLSVVDGSVRGQPLANPHGNLAYANGVLLVATPTELWGYVLDPNESAAAIPPQTLAPTDNVPPFQMRVRNVPAPEPWDWPRATVALGAARGLTPGSWPIRQSTPDGKTILVCDGFAIWAWPADLSKPLWKAVLKTPANLMVATYDDGYWIASGSTSITSVKASDGTVRWQFECPNSKDSFEGGSLVGSRYVACLGTRCVLALDLATGHLAWLRDSLGRPRYREFTIDSSPRFNPLFLAVGEVVILQKDDGERWTLGADTGRILHTAPTCPTPWTTPPTVTPDGCVLIADGAGLVVALEPSSNLALWRFEAGGETSLSGAAPEIRNFGADAFVSISRNYGRELLRLDEKTGNRVWKSPALIPGIGMTFADVQADAERLYVPNSRGVVCVSRSIGKPVWQSEWPSEGRWQTIVTRQGLIASRTEPIPEEPFPEVFERILTRLRGWPSPGRLLGWSITLMRATFAGTATVLLFDATTGKLTSRTEVSVLGPKIHIQRTGLGSVLLSTGAAHSLTAGP